MLSQLGSRQMIGNDENSYGDDFEKDIGLLLHEHRRRDADDLDREQNIYRSGSAPPTVEGSFSAVGGLLNHGVGAGSYIGGSAMPEFARNNTGNGLLSEEDLRSDPAYLSYYYSNVNLNPRLPPPLLSREDWRSTQGFRGGSSAIGDRRKVNTFDGGSGGRSQFRMPPGFNSANHENDNEDKLGSVDWGGDGLIGLPGLGPASNQKSLDEIFQEELNLSAPVSRHPSRPTSRSAFDDSNAMLLAEAELAHFRSELASLDPVHTTSNNQNASSTPYGGLASYSYAAGSIASLSRSSTPDPQLIARAPSPNPTPIGGGRVGNREKKPINTTNISSSLSNGSLDLVGSLSGLNLSDGKVSEENNLSSGIEKDAANDNSYLFNGHGDQNNMRPQIYMQKTEPGKWNMPSAPQAGKLRAYDYGSKDDGSSELSNNLYILESSNTGANGGSDMLSHFQHMDSPNSSFSNYEISGYPMSPMSGQVGSSRLLQFGNAAAAMVAPRMGPGMLEGSNIGSASVNHSLSKMRNQMTVNALQGSYVDPLFLQYLRSGEYVAAQVAGLSDSSTDRSYMGNSYTDLLQKAYIENLLATQKSHYSVPLGGNTGVASPHGYYANPAFGIGMTYPGSPLASPLFQNSLGGPGIPIMHGDFNFRIPVGARSSAAGVTGPWHIDNIDNSFGSSLLEEFKNNKTKSFELSEIAGHVVEFSADQYGSRFIQQKLETASTEEKNMVFDEIFPQALTLMTDVFGNYVIQKFFEHGMDEQRRQLAGELFEHVLTLSLQMYGCRVIQKAIEVVDVDQKIKMVKELDGHVMRCVRDQNGNHVLQKCIECAPEEHIQFIVSTFFDQVITLSTHPYGCRVIQRVLEHCKDVNTQSKVMEEILGSVSMLAQDQYGNYVIQHVLEHGKPHERSTIIQELAGKIVQMSQQKFASNVVEKCLAFGDPSERQLLVSEMLGTTDENEPLQAMMKDQFANYVVQKVLETCNDQQRELILFRIKVHLNALKKYTYGKHIVARVEKLVAAGERRMAAQSLNSV